MKKVDDLGDRMKGYENGYRHYLPKRLPVLIRIDGKAFHTFTKGMKRPFDQDLSNAMWETVKHLCANIQGCKIGYTQSDEITLYISNFDQWTTESWFDNNLQKMVSIAASLATAKFNEEIRKVYPEKGLALFDARAWVVPHDEVVNAFIWRQQDATKNSVSMVAQSQFSHKELQGLKGQQMKEKLESEKDIKWDELPVWQKSGVAIIKKQVEKAVEYNGQKHVVKRNVWAVDEETPIFSTEREYIDRYVFKEKEQNEVDDNIIKAIQLLQQGKTEEEVRAELMLSDNDIKIADFVANEF